MTEYKKEKLYITKNNNITFKYNYHSIIIIPNNLNLIIYYIISTNHSYQNSN